MLSDAPARLVHYCRRVPLTAPDYVEVNDLRVRYVGRVLRRVAWRDVEVRDALLEAGDEAVWEALVEDLRCAGAEGEGLNLLDLASAMTLEAGLAPTRDRV